MSRRKRPSGSSAPVSAAPEQAPRAEPRSSGSLAIDLGILAAVFAITVGIAELAGAANLGVAVGIGQVTFAIALVVLLLGRDLAALQREYHGVQPSASAKLRHGIAHMRSHRLA